MRSMRLVIAAAAIATGCTNDLMSIGFVRSTASGAGGHWFIGAELGETIELSFNLDADDISNSSGWSVEIDGPVGADTVVPLTGLTTIGSVTIPANANGVHKLEDQSFTFHLVDRDGTVRESRRWASTIVNPAADGPRAWLWAAFWTAGGERLLDGFTDCSSQMTVAAYVGGDLSVVSRVTFRIIDVDLGTDDLLESGSLAIRPDERVYEFVVSDPCKSEGTNDGNDVDPKFEAILFGTDGAQLDKVDGPELD